MDSEQTADSSTGRRGLTPLGAFFERGRAVTRAWPEDRRRQLEEQVFFEEDQAWPYLWRFEAMTRGRTLGGSRAALSITTARAQDPMFDTPPKCLLHRQASFHVDNLPDGTVVGPGGDTDIFVFPAMDPSQPNPVLSGGDMAAAFNDDPDTIALMGYLADRRSGEAWARAGGFLSPHDEFDVDIYGTDYDRRVAEILAAAEIIRFDASDQMIPPVGTRSFLEAVLHLFRTGDVRESVEIAQSGYPND